MIVLKKVLYILITIIISTVSFAKDFNVTKGRQDAVNRFYDYWVKNKIPYRFDGVNDCGGLVKDVYKAGNITFKQGAASNGRNSQGMFNSTNIKIGKSQVNLLKPGDALFFTRSGAGGGIGHTGIVLENPSKQCNGGILMGHTSNPKKPPHTKCLNPNDKTFAGAISYAEMVRLNGYNPVDDNGQVITPDGSSVIGSGNSMSSASTKSSLMVDWDAIQNDFVQMIDEGLGKLTPGLLVLLSVLTVLEIMWVLYGYIAKNSIENVWLSLIRIAIRFSILAYFIPNAIKLIDMGYEIFSGIGSYFMRNSGTVTLNSIWAVAGREAAKVLKIIGESNFNFWNLVTNQQLFFEELAKIVLLFGIILLIYYFVIRILFHMLMAVLQFRMALGLSWIFLPFDVNSITKRDLGNKALTTFFLAGTKIVVVMAMSGIIFKNLDTTSFGEITFKELEFQSIFLYITVGMVMAFVMNKVDDIVITLARN
ncbi:type IV secretion system protein [Leptotrichia trevisanii]|uniref:type IV secretion system protein n=1 Tax=Leptotrichia trevisanii TaxID=109328 RepID=UPI0026F2AA03|nr:type IV secretion system protein [Leptotrichia trevisanii]